MTALTARKPDTALAIPQALPAPPVPASVAGFARAVQLHAEARAAFAAASEAEREQMFVGSPPRPPMLAERERAEAKRAADAIAWQLRPVPPALFRAWLGPVNAAVRNPQGAEDFEVRCAGLHALLDDLPAGCFTAEARRALPAFFPSAEDIRRAVEPGARRLRALADALTASLAPVPGPTLPGSAAPPSPEERAAMLAQARQVAAELRANADAREAGDRPAAKAVPLSDGALLALYEAMGDAGKHRAAVLRRRLAAAGA
jgi:hypothetical protein